MGKRQRSETNDENDVKVNRGKRSSSEFGRPFSDNVSPVMTITGSSQSDNDVDVVWGHSPPPVNLKLCSTPGPKTRRRSDFSSKDIADMIQCVNSRNNSQQSPTISTPPLLGLWMQGRQEVDTTPVIARNEHRSLRRTSSRRQTNDTWATLAKDLHMLAEQSQTARISSVSFEADSNSDQKDETIASENDDEDLFGDIQPPVDDENCKLTSELRSQVNQEEKCQNVEAVEEPMEELWEDESWFENESFVKLATQMEEQAFSQKPQGGETTLTKALVQDGGACPLSKTKKDASSHFIEPKKSKQLKDVNSQFVSLPNVNQMALKKTFHSSPSVPKPSVVTASDKCSFKFPQTKQNQFQGNVSQFPKNVLPPSSSEQSRAAHKEGVPSKLSTSLSKVVSQFEKKTKESGSKEPYHKDNFSTVGSATKVVEIKAPISENVSAARNDLASKDKQQGVDHDCSVDLFDSSLTEDGQEMAITTVIGCKGDSNINRRNSQMESKVNSSPAARSLRRESDLFSDNSLLDEELLAAVEKEEEQWDLICSQQTGEVDSSNIGTVDGCGKTVGFAAKQQFHSLARHNQHTQNFQSKLVKFSASLQQQNICSSKEETTRQVSNFKAPTCSQFTYGTKSSTLRGKGNISTASQFCRHAEDIKTSQRSNFHSNTTNSLHHELSVASNNQAPAPSSTGQLVTLTTSTYVSSQISQSGNVAKNPRVSRSTFQFGRTQKLTANPTPISQFGPQSLKEAHVKPKSNEFIREEISDVTKVTSEVPTGPLTSQFPSKVLLVKGAAGSGFNASYLSQSSQFSSGSQLKTQDDGNCSEVTPSPVFEASKSSVNHSKPPQTSAPSTVSSKSTKDGQGNESSSKYSVASKEHVRTGVSIQGQSSQCMKTLVDKSHDQPFTNHVISSSIEPMRKTSIHGQSSQFMKASCHKSSDGPLTKVSSSSVEPLRTNSSLQGQSSQFMRALPDKSNDGPLTNKDASSSIEPFKPSRTNSSHQSLQFMRAAGDKVHDPTLADKSSSSSKELLGKNFSNKGQSSQFVKVTDGSSHDSLLKKKTCIAPSAYEPQTKSSVIVAFQSCVSDGKMANMNKPRQQGPNSFQFSRAKKMSSQSQQNLSRSSTSMDPSERDKASKDTISVTTGANAITVGSLVDRSKTTSSFCQFNSNPKAKGLMMPTVSGQGQDSPQMVKRTVSPKTGDTRSDISGMSITTEKVGNDKDGAGLITSSEDLTKRTCSQEEIERKRLEALARKKEKVVGNHRMSLRNRSLTKKS